MYTPGDQQMQSSWTQTSSLAVYWSLGIFRSVSFCECVCELVCECECVNLCEFVWVWVCMCVSLWVREFVWVCVCMCVSFCVREFVCLFLRPARASHYKIHPAPYLSIFKGASSSAAAGSPPPWDPDNFSNRFEVSAAIFRTCKLSLRGMLRSNGPKSGPRSP